MKKILILSVMIGLLSGCTTGTIISNEGTTKNPKWHKIDAVTFNKDKGTFPNIQSLEKVTKGMTKDQLYYLIGRPQYDDGWRPKEWNYLLHFNTPGQGENDISTCQFKILFDKNMLASGFYWNPVIPQDGICPPNLTEKVAVVVKEQPISIKKYQLGADALFAFDKSDLNNLNSKGLHDLDNLISDLRNLKEIKSINISGYTDHLGSNTYNLTLSQNRADTIRQYLIQQGVDTTLITAQGFGKSDPVKQCDNQLSKTQLINCLQPNRRIKIEVIGYGK